AGREGDTGHRRTPASGRVLTRRCPECQEIPLASRPRAPRRRPGCRLRHTGGATHLTNTCAAAVSCGNTASVARSARCGPRSTAVARTEGAPDFLDHHGLRRGHPTHRRGHTRDRAVQGSPEIVE